MKLPEEFVERMRNTLGEEAEAFFQQYEKVPVPGLRLNPCKVEMGSFWRECPFTLQPIPWIPGGYYYGQEERPGKHPYHEAGLYYIQEPSAMAVAPFVAPKPGERVLDLCAAPGGKTTQLAALMENKGLLVSNEIHPTRAKILSQNVERWGITNTVVTNETPDRLAAHFPFFFDRVLVDAPCSGEGMFRKDPDTCEQWSRANVQMCAQRQLVILNQIKDTVKEGGRLVYSTCTFSEEENEQVLDQFLRENPDFQLEEVQVPEGFGSNRKGTLRLWPHRLQGEGHFIGVLHRVDGAHKARYRQQTGIRIKELTQYHQFGEQALKGIAEGTFVLFGENLYCVPEEMVSMEKMKVVRPGLHLGTMKKNWFEPSHALALSLKPEEAIHTLSLTGDGREVQGYLKGETLFGDGALHGWVLITVDGYSLGWGKAVNGTVKNHYPKGLRWK